MLLVYTAVFSIPFSFVLFHSFTLYHTFSYSSLSFCGSSGGVGLFYTLVVLLTFCVKLPIYGLHFWLPMAHVEAPTFGSIILAGVLLKLGGAGLIRFSYFIDVRRVTQVGLSYLIVFLIFATLVCCFQSDFKRLVAYSSVSHMMAIPLLFISSSSVSNSVLVLAMLLHGLASPILFMLVGVFYSIFNTRQLSYTRGVFLLNPLLAFVVFVAFLFTLSAPPFSTFISEVFFFVSCHALTESLLPFYFLFSFFSLVYNLNWVSSSLFSSAPATNSSFSISFLPFYTFFLFFSASFFVIAVSAVLF
jgi:NADH:ubiquinone oxidoreductase subunit 4 (subunit M)